MGKLMKGGISYGGVADIDITNEPIILTVGEIPSDPHDGMTVLYQGENTLDFTQNHIYQYSETDEEWIDITTAKSISLADIDVLFD